MATESRLKFFFILGFFFTCFLVYMPLAEAQQLAAEAESIPWSGYWWPTQSGALANGYQLRDEPAPLEKYEFLLDGRYPGQATSWELQHNFDPEAPSWFGQCNGWAAAAAYENIDIVPSVMDRILFRVGDKKGLLSTSHFSDPAVYGSGSPESFHEFLLTYLYLNKKAFVANLGSKDQTWFYPIYRFDMHIDEHSDHQIVTVQIWYADDQVKPDFQGTVEKTDIFEYSLQLNSQGEVTGGEWLDSSVYDHPRSVFFPLSPQPRNPYLDYQAVRNIALDRDDELESDSPVVLPQGHFDLVLLNEDQYYFDVSSGDVIDLIFTRNDDLSESALVTVTDESGTQYLNAALDDHLDLKIQSDFSQRFFVSVTRPDYVDAGIYQVDYDRYSPSDTYQPSLRRGSAWNGCALTNAGDHTITGLSLVACDRDGHALVTLFGPADLPAGNKILFSVDATTVMPADRTDIYVLKVTRGMDLVPLFLGGDWQKDMSAFGRMNPAASQLVVPDVSSMFDVHKSVSFGVQNLTGQEQESNFFLYNVSGLFVGAKTVSLNPHSILNYSESSNPIKSSLSNGWYLLETNASKALSGYVNWNYGADNYESNFVLTDQGTDYIFPHVTVSTPWSTQITLINLTDQFNVVSFTLTAGGGGALETVVLDPHEKREFTLSVDLFSGYSAGILDAAALQIHSSGLMSGYGTYLAAADSKARFPLLLDSDAAKSLVLPHVASDDYWWTGIILYNQDINDMAVKILPHAPDGRLLEDGVVTRIVAGEGKDVFTLKSILSGNLLAQTAWVEFQSDLTSLFGYVLYGDVSLNVVAGIVLPSND